MPIWCLLSLSRSAPRMLLLERRRDSNVCSSRLRWLKARYVLARVRLHEIVDSTSLTVVFKSCTAFV